ncbi:jg6217 [Pararge aegeria aegeria]|uniref:Jg6217 protein n=1 Tax=Pararge aegeria aegeria TaxID=348720 RepID=A0A8S4RP33_9NEOP|nr:jg6217 [Pararge aegeria aegeria]
MPLVSIDSLHLISRPASESSTNTALTSAGSPLQHLETLASISPPVLLAEAIILAPQLIQLSGDSSYSAYVQVSDGI